VFPGLTRAQQPSSIDTAAIDQYVQDQMDGSNIPGVAIAIVEGDEIRYAQGYGSAGNDRDVTTQTPFPVGSLVKSFTAVAVMQLAEAGKLDLDQPVTTYLPWFQVGDGTESPAITLRHLLNQTSGLSRETGIEPLYEQRARTLEEVVRDLQGEELNRPVGETYEYSNANFSTLALVIETVAGQPFGDYLNEHILGPLGMVNSSAVEDATRANMTSQYQYWFGRAVEVDDPWLPERFPGEYLIASAEDMARYAAMYLNGGAAIVTPESIDQMLTPATNESTRQLLSTDFTFRYGMGWFVGSFGAEENAVWHLGELPYFNAWTVILPESDRAVVVMINAGSQMELFDANEVMSRIPIGVVNILGGQAPPAGIGLTRFYIYFDLIVLAVVAVQLWALTRLVRCRMTPVSMPKTVLLAAPMVWEIGLGLGLLLGYQTLLGMSIRGSFLAFPDLSIALLTIGALWLITGLARILRLGQKVAADRHSTITPTPRLVTAIRS
jgi:CubicO group peptidase (beta-lactamase class C family)